MAIIVEDGTGIFNANSYNSAAEFKSYWVAVGYDFSSYTNSEIEIALIRATRYVESRFRNVFYGWRQTDTQALSWPRTGVLVNWLPLDGTVPISLKNAINEYAKRALPATAELSPDPADTDSTGQIIKRARKKIGPIETETEYMGGSGQIIKPYPSADRWLADLLSMGNEVIRA